MNKLPPLNPDNSVPPERIKIIIKRLMAGDVEYSELSYHDRCSKQVTLQSLEKLAIKSSQKDVFLSVPMKFRDDEDVMKAAYGVNHKNLGLASTRLRQDKSFVLSAIAKYPKQTFSPWTAIGSVEDEKFLLNVLELSSSSFMDMPSTIRSNIDIALRVVSKNGRMLKFCPVSLRDNHAIVKAATSNFPHAILDATHECMRKNDIILPLLANDCTVFKDLPDSVINKKMCLVAVENMPTIYRGLKEPFYSDKDIALTAIENGLSLEDLHTDLRSNADFIGFMLDEDILGVPAYLEQVITPEKMSAMVKRLGTILQSKSQASLDSMIRYADCSDEDASKSDIVPNPPSKDNIAFVEKALTSLDERHLAKLTSGVSALRNSFLNSLVTEEVHRRNIAKIVKVTGNKEFKERKTMP